MKCRGLVLLAVVSAVVTTSPHVHGSKPNAAATRSATAAGSAPDFWYVVPRDAPETADHTLVRGIVIPTTVEPTVRTSLAGSVLSWERTDGTRQSVAVQGLSSFSFKPGPLKGTMLVPFVDARRLQYFPDYGPKGCCACASWQNSEESVELLNCVPGCVGCGCEGCICSPTYPCPMSSFAAMTLRAHNNTASTISFGERGGSDEIVVGARGRNPVRFRGGRVSARIASDGSTEIVNPESIALSGDISTNSIVRGDTAFFAWSSPETTVIVEQPKTMPAPALDDGTIELSAHRGNAPATNALRLEPMGDRCIVCGTHPNSDGDSEKCECVAGTQTCTRCINFACDSPGL